MANIKSAKKRIKVISKKTLRNKMVKSATKTAVKKAQAAIAAGDKAAAEVACKNAIAAIDRAYTKGIFHKNAAARKKSTIQRLYNAM
ncbi:MAG: 30S ribosomal protein S20 [Clostridia bacterium]|nr:30S ribosomal protein S20 [Clostridia bacterium]